MCTHLGRQPVADFSAWIELQPILDLFYIPVRKPATIRSLGQKATDEYDLVFVAAPFQHAVWVCILEVRALPNQKDAAAVHRDCLKILERRALYHLF